MSMIGCFQRVPEQTIRDVLAKPKMIENVLDGAADGAQLDIDKAWHALHFLLTGEAEVGEPPLDFILTGGEAVGDIDVGYGPARAFSAGEVRDIAAALAPITVDTLRERFDPAAMDEAAIYPEIWMRDPEEDDVFGYLADHYASLKTFVSETAQAGLGMLAYLS